jgi:ADP-dependent NAD(P)H-hydrate dehydratase / NAD(P)H-hydrate epimerase
MPARVASAEETRACERATIQSGITSGELMRRAGHGAASLIVARYDKAARTGAVVYTGPGNNGGDGWVLAEALAKSGIPSCVVEAGAPRSEEAMAARDSALATGSVRIVSAAHSEQLVVDALLGTGATGAPRGEIADAIRAIEYLSESGATVIALDIPSGLDATTGEHTDCVHARATVSFGVAKRGQLIARDVCGEISVIDIGLVADDECNALPLLIDDEWAHSRIPEIPVSAHKGTRKRLAVVGGGKGMAGAAILAGEGALRSGIGLLRIVCDDESVVPVHAAIPAALVSTWPQSADDLAALSNSEDCVAVGPGLGNTTATRDLVERILLGWTGPVVLDADALNVFAGDASSLSRLLGGRSAILTPHPVEMARLIGVETSEVLANRFDIGSELARTTGAAVLLKGAPTVVFTPAGERYVSASGTAALATGGSGDVLTGVAATLLAQMSGDINRAGEAAACAAFIHGRAAERCRFVRGITLSDVLEALPLAWNEKPRRFTNGIIAELESHQ